MPNYCNYEMKVVGGRSNVEEFFKVLSSDYDYTDGLNYSSFDRHFFRIFEAYSHDFSYEKDENNRPIANTIKHVKIDSNEDTIVEAIISGYCAWSVASCMMPGGYSYYETSGRPKGSNLILESKNLNIDIEVFSEESGMCFMEHLIIESGVVTTEECEDYEEQFDEKTGEGKTTGGIEWNYSISDCTYIEKHIDDIINKIKLDMKKEN